VERQTGIENIYDEANYRYVHYMEQGSRPRFCSRKGVTISGSASRLS